VSRILIAIGSAEATVRRRTVLRAFLAAADGPGCRIAVVPSASSLGPEVVDVYRTVFTALGAADVVPQRPTSPRQPDQNGQESRSGGVFASLA
jgi:cyanophycinase